MMNTGCKLRYIGIMKNFLLIALIFLMTIMGSPLMMSRAVAGEQPGEVGVYRLPPEAMGILVEMKATVRHGRVDGDFIAELTLEQAEILRMRGFQPIQLFDSIAGEDEAFRKIIGFDEFHTYEEIISGLYNYAANYPEITHLEHLGYSVQGRELLAMKITDNPEVEEDEVEGIAALILNDFDGLMASPNPFNEKVSIKFVAAKTGKVNISVYNIMGQKVAELFDGLAAANQINSLTFNASGKSTGIYFCRMMSDDNVTNRKLLYLK